MTIAEFQDEHAKHEAERKKLATGVTQPPVDNAHVEKGATLFSQEDINSNKENTEEKSDEGSEENDIKEESSDESDEEVTEDGKEGEDSSLT